MHTLRDNFLSGKQCDAIDWLTVNGTLCAASQLHARPGNFQLDPLALHSTLLSAHFLSNQPLVANSAPLSPLSELSKSQFLPSMLLASSLPRKPTPWYPWSLTASSGLLNSSNFDSTFSAHANLFAAKDAKEGNYSLKLQCRYNYAVSLRRVPN